jgi:ribosomal protein S18 acetylase RimI-like enzyme
LNREMMLELFNKHMRIDICYPGYRRDRTDSVIRQVSLEKETGFLLYSEMDESTADVVIAEQIAFFEQVGQPFEWKVFDYDQPVNLRDRLQAKGFTIEEQEALMVVDLTEGNHLLDIPVQPEIRRITDERGIRDVVGLEDDVWGISHHELGERLVQDFLDDSVELFVYAAYVDEKVVCAAWMYLHNGTPFASLWGGSTLPQFRKRGFYSSLLGIRAQEAATKGYRFLMVDASSMSQPILEKQGFLCLATSNPCISPK